MPTKFHKSLDHATGRDLATVFDELKKGDLIFRTDFQQIALHFLSYFLPENPFQIDFSTLRSSFIENANLKEEITVMSVGGATIDHIQRVPEDPADFYKYICRKYLDLELEPRQCLLEAYSQTIEDLNEIDDTIKSITSQLEHITKANEPERIQKDKPILNYYLKHNEQEKTSIMSFLKNDIKMYALSKSYGHNLLSGLMLRIPYNYRWNPKMYKPREPNVLLNKFELLTVSELQDLNKLYSNDPAAFKSYLQKYIADEEIIYSLQELVGSHHILSPRALVIAEAIASFENGNKLFFASGLPSIIEGILHDMCILAGVPEQELLEAATGFQKKIDLLHPLLGLSLHYEYYSFHFRILRNKIAHGRLSSKDVEEYADLMLLDLHHICRLVFNHRFPINHKLFLIDELSKSQADPDLKFLLEYLFLTNVDVPGFYGVEDKIDVVDKLLITDSFVKFLEEHLSRGDVTSKHGVFSALIILKKYFPELKAINHLIKKAGIKKQNTAYVKDFIASIRNYYY